MTKGKLSRRAVLAGTASAVGTGLMRARQQTTDPSKVQGAPARLIGERSSFEQPRHTLFSSARSASNTPLQDLEGLGAVAAESFAAT